MIGQHPIYQLERRSDQVSSPHNLPSLWVLRYINELETPQGRGDCWTLFFFIIVILSWRRSGKGINLRERMGFFHVSLDSVLLDALSTRICGNPSSDDENF